MDRRLFVAAGAASGLSLAVAPSAGAPVPTPAEPRPGPVDDMDAYLATVDAGMARIGRWSVTERYPGYAGDREATDALARTALQTLYLTGMFGDLPREQQLHPGMRQRVLDAVPLMDEALERMEGFLYSRTDDELARVQAALRGPHHVAERVADILDEQAALTGTSPWRREQLRAMVRQAGWRLANQPPALLIEEYRRKIERLDASNVSAEVRRRFLASRVGEQLFWDRAGTDRAGLVSTGAVADTVRTLRERRLARGVTTMGIGALIFGVGYLVADGKDVDDDGFAAGAVTATVGAIVFLVGFLTLLVGLATSKDAVAVEREPRRRNP